MTDLIARGIWSQSLKDQGKSRTAEPDDLRLPKESQSLKDQGKSRTYFAR